MNRKQFLQSVGLATIGAAVRLRGAAPQMKVYKTPTCGCCGKWVQHLRDNGFEVTVQEVADTAEYRTKAGIPSSLASCHTGFVEGYGIEGHVPAADIQRLLKEHPKAKGLSVPGMPMGSPGMEGPRSQPYSVMLVDSEGRTSVYQTYPRP